ncbi:hypothetical protein Ancab_040177 [Ancistrocladus abbreviatus]
MARCLVVILPLSISLQLFSDFPLFSLSPWGFVILCRRDPSCSKEVLKNNTALENLGSFSKSLVSEELSTDLPLENVVSADESRQKENAFLDDIFLDNIDIVRRDSNEFENIVLILIWYQEVLIHIDGDKTICMLDF